ncbi:MAG: YbjQ family protein [Clostridia bacterium]|nr:YbjQ family protein [Clostridia bacterium]MBT7123241.1 YbjQ family protein [Clostridia bacterium]
MIIMTTEHINKDFEVLGLVRGSMIQSKHLGRDMMAGFKTLVGGELKGYTQMMEESREQALRRMSSQADTLGADAIIGMRFTSSSLMQGAAEITAYGTAIKYK